MEQLRLCTRMHKAKAMPKEGFRVRSNGTSRGGKRRLGGLSTQGLQELVAGRRESRRQRALCSEPISLVATALALTLRARSR